MFRSIEKPALPLDDIRILAVPIFFLSFLTVLFQVSSFVLAEVTHQQKSPASQLFDTAIPKQFEKPNMNPALPH